MGFLRVGTVAAVFWGAALSDRAAGQSLVDPALWSPASIDEVPDPATWPLRFKAISHDCGKVLAGEQVSARFEFVNATSERIAIRAEGGCGGWWLRWNKAEYMPGEKGEVEVVCTSRELSRFGRRSRVLPLFVLEGPEARMALEVSVDWVPEIILEPSRFRFPRARRGEARVHSVVIAGRSPEFLVTDASADLGRLRVHSIEEIAPLDVGGHPYRAYEVHIELPGTSDVGYVHDRVTIQTNDSRSSEWSSSGGGQVVGEVFVGGDRAGFLCEVRGDEEIAAKVNLVSWSGRPFRVAEIETAADERFKMGDVELEVTVPVAQAELGGYATLALRARLLNPERRWWLGWVTVTTDVPGEEPLRVPVYIVRATPHERPLP